MTNAELAILGLLVERPRHGYEIERVIEARGMRDWTEVGFSSIYYLLKKLEAAGLVAGRLDHHAGRGPARRVFAATSRGQDTWRRETLRALAEPQRCYPSFLLGLAGLPAFEDDEIAAALDAYVGRLDERRQEIADARARTGPELPDHVAAMFDYSEALLDAEQAWVSAQARRIGEEELL